MRTPWARSILYPDCGPTTRWTDFPRGDMPLPNTIVDVLPDDSSGYPISRALGRLVAHLVLHRSIHNVLELGAGSSSIVLARSLMMAGGGRLTSVEQSPQWCREAWERVTETPRVDAHLVAALPAFRMLPSGPCHLYATAQGVVAERGPYDLVLVDAPQWYYGRDGALPLAARSLSPGALIVVDDAGRPQERWTIRRWLQTYPGVTLIAFDPDFGRNGVAILRSDDSLTRRFSVWAWISASIHAGANWMVRATRKLDSDVTASALRPVARDM